ncbi:hypothetical protein M3Y94_01075100 [Aphelenchoides besseyi]|nr:hypothetical protein M3Y94_01075100 [Aphelenchoides besseyi]
MSTSSNQLIRLRNFEICVLIDQLANRNEDALAFACDSKLGMKTQTAAEFFKNGGEMFKNFIKLLRSLPLPGRITAFPIVLASSKSIQTKIAIVVPLDNSSIRQMTVAFRQVFGTARENAIESLALEPLGLDFLRLTRDMIVHAIVSALTSDHNFGSLKTLKLVVNDQDAVDFYSTFFRLVALSDYNQHPEYYTEAQAPFQVRPVASQVLNSPITVLPQPQPMEMPRPFAIHFKVFTKTEFEAKRKELLEAQNNNKSSEAENEEILHACAFCMEELFDEQTDYTVEGNRTVIQLNKCDHMFHRKCIVSFFKNNTICPSCRQE